MDTFCQMNSGETALAFYVAFAFVISAACILCAFLNMLTAMFKNM